ncbi:MAG: hypothetical protein AAF460_02420 [Pseudomonadota bacterium]
MTSDDKPKAKLIKLNGRASRGRSRRQHPPSPPAAPNGLRPVDDLHAALGIDGDGKVTPLRDRRSATSRDRTVHRIDPTRKVVRLHPTPEPPLHFPRVNHRILRDESVDRPPQRTLGAGLRTRPPRTPAPAEQQARPVPPFEAPSRGPVGRPVSTTTDYSSVRHAFTTPVTLDRWTQWFKLLCVGIVLLLTLLTVSAL